jgi:hypothetical protein
MGKTVVKHEDVEKLYERMEEEGIQKGLDWMPYPTHDEFVDLVGEIFGITLPDNKEE